MTYGLSFEDLNLFVFVYGKVGVDREGGYLLTVFKVLGYNESVRKVILRRSVIPFLYDSIGISLLYGSAEALRGTVSAFYTLAEGKKALGVGVGEKPKEYDLAAYVLGRFTAEDRRKVEEAFADAADAVSLMVRDETNEAMNRYNRKKAQEPKTEPKPQPKGAGQEPKPEPKPEPKRAPEKEE